jgi:hypothetical protein
VRGREARLHAEGAPYVALLDVFWKGVSVSSAPGLEVGHARWSVYHGTTI